jgi:hypothetical protein
MADYSKWTHIAIVPVTGSTNIPIGYLLNYPLKITIPYAPQMNLDFSDIRFGNYLYEKIGYVSGVSAIFYVYIPYIRGYPLVDDLYIWSGNPDAIDMSVKGSILDPYYPMLNEDFDGTELNLSKWDVNSGLVSVADSVLTLNDTVDQNVTSKIETPTEATTIVEMKVKFDEANPKFGIGTALNIFAGFSKFFGNPPWTPADPIGKLQIYSNNHGQPQSCILGDGEIWGEPSPTSADNKYHIVGMRFTEHAGLWNFSSCLYYVDGVYVGSNTDDSMNAEGAPPSTPGGHLKVFLNNLANSNLEIDYIRMRNYIPNPPTVGTIVWHSNVPYQLTDLKGNTVVNILFESAYLNEVCSDKIIKIGSDIYNLFNIKLTPVASIQGNIPKMMKVASEYAFQYLELSLDQKNYSNVLNISEIPRNVEQLIYVRCNIPDYAYSGAFMCQLDIELETI